MKRIALIMACLMLSASFTACGGVTTDGEEKKPTDVSVEEKDAEQKAFKETVVYDDNGVKITVKGISTDSFMGPELKILIENDSEENITVQTSNTSVNGYMITAILSSDVAVGKKVNDSVTFLSTDIEENGIEEIETIDISFRIFNTDTWMDIAETETVTITF